VVIVGSLRTKYSRSVPFANRPWRGISVHSRPPPVYTPLPATFTLHLYNPGGRILHNTCTDATAPHRPPRVHIARRAHTAAGVAMVALLQLGVPAHRLTFGGFWTISGSVFIPVNMQKKPLNSFLKSGS